MVRDVAKIVLEKKATITPAVFYSVLQRRPERRVLCRVASLASPEYPEDDISTHDITQYLLNSCADCNSSQCMLSPDDIHETLQATVLPRLEESDLISYDESTGLVAPTENTVAACRLVQAIDMICAGEIDGGGFVGVHH